MHMYVLTMQLLLLLFQFLSVSSREHPMDLITFNSMRQLPGNTLDPDDQAAQAASHPSGISWKFLRGPLDLLWGVPKTPTALGLPKFLPLISGTSVTSGFFREPPHLHPPRFFSTPPSRANRRHRVSVLGQISRSVLRNRRRDRYKEQG